MKDPVLQDAPEDHTILAGTIKRYTEKAVLFQINFFRAQERQVKLQEHEIRSLWFPLSRCEILQELESDQWDMLDVETWLLEKNNLFPNAD